jgi:hypothetical protein
VSRLKEREQRRAAEWERQARSGRIFITGMFVAIAGLVAGIAFGAADIRYTLAGAVAASAGAVLLGAQLMRIGLQTRAVRRLFWYSGGLAQQDLDEPEPSVLRWDEVDSVTPLIYDDSGCVAGPEPR